MKIRKIRSIVVDAYRAGFVFAVVETDDGIVGYGEGTVEFHELAVAQAIEGLGLLLVDSDPFDTDAHVEFLLRESYWRTGVTIRSAISAIEGALLDVKGKALGIPVYQLLGGRHRDRVRCYANGWFTGAQAPEDFAEKARVAVAAGFSALKWDPFGTAYLTLDRVTRNRVMETVEAVREAVGPGVDILIEAHGRFDVPTAISIAKDLLRFDPLFLEEPVPPESLDALAEVRRRSPIPIAAGERIYEPARFQELLRQDAVDYLQPDVCHVGGIGEAKRIAAMAHARYLPIAPHNPQGPIANAMTLHLAAAIPNFFIHETMITDVPWRSEIARENITMVDGDKMMIPSGPGLGVELDEEACSRYPYVHHELRHYRGIVTAIRPPDARPFYRSGRAT